MAGFQHVKVIEVLIWGRRVGAVAPDPTLGANVFEYDEAWARSGIELAPFTMPVDNATRRFVFPGLDPDAFKGLPGLLSDALPDRFGNQLIDAWMAAHGYSPAQITAIDRLAYMGRRGMGALEFRPARGGQSRSSAPIQMATLVELARQAVEGTLQGNDASAEALNRIISVGTSAGGARAKAVLGWNPATHGLISGQFDLPDGYEPWLLKFDGMGQDRTLGPSQQYGRIEFAYSRMAAAAGVRMSDCRLLEESGRAHFMTRRFDRDGNGKVHVQSLCALQHMSFNLRQTHAYESLFLTAKGLQLDDDAMNQLFRRMAFNVAARNHDDHTKNFAFLLRQGGQWALAPAFDVTFAYDPDNVWLSQHLMSVNGRFDGITRADLVAVADRFSIPGVDAALADVNAAMRGWRQFATDASIGQDEIDRIAGLHITV